ncbi:putative undecaprenyl pyrophosphate protein [Chaetomidium leptoderma]|uniref:tRNA (guanine(37)-N1)-methyltransferase n=1 Tax=Chaetomidium leptoderma TaxID=669021 RepID=A0AAN6VQP9_9PEZI|nr:putative undecaprenyl pyrophosphate protein [Chaetomidium leptoderma]
MPFISRDLEAYRRDERLGHKLLTPEERIRLLKPYLPSPPPRSRSRSRTESSTPDARAEKQARLGVRRFLRRQYHVLVFTLIHVFFSLYIRIRQACHAVANRIYSVYYHHHRTPELIRRDVKGLGRLPKHVSVILTLEDQRRSGAGLERLINEVTDVAAWCASAGIPQLSIYEKTASARRTPPASNLPWRPMGQTSRKHLSIVLISAEDGRDSMVDLTKTLAEMSQRKKLNTADISMELVDAELSESVMSEPDLLILFSPHVELAGYPPWQIRLTEIFHVRDNQGVGYQVFYRALRNPPGKDCCAEEEMSIFRPPIVRSGTAALNRALFSKKIKLAAAAVQDNKLISQYRKTLQSGREILRVDRISPIRSHPDKALAEQGRKCLLLAPSVTAEASDTWGPVLKEGVQKQELTVVPYELQLDYDYWNHRDIMVSILPEELHDEIPVGFNVAGHVAHLNLRDNYLPYKQIVAEILLDKNPQIKTVINKIDNVGSESEFRTFQYEVLAGPDDMNVQVTENHCVFEFDYAKVYWNSKLEAEHGRLANLFQPGEVVCDVMAGIGPFAVPAGKRRVFVWANDKNPESYKYLEVSIKNNKVAPFVRPFCEDGRAFIHQAADSVLEASQKGECAVTTHKEKKQQPPPQKDDQSDAKKKSKSRPVYVVREERTPIPPTIAHFVMNLPASAIEFLSSYRGVYAGREALFAPHTATKLPLVHVHCFSYKADDETPRVDICERITKELGFAVRPAAVTTTMGAAAADDGNGDDDEEEGVVRVHNVRDVAPTKSMYCASFRLPREVAFAPRG